MNYDKVEEVVSELKDNSTLTEIINKRYKKPVREVIVYLDMDAALEAADLAMELSQVKGQIKYKQENEPISLSGEELRDELELEKTITKRLADLNERIQESKLVWTVKAMDTKEWTEIDERARTLFPVDMENATEAEKNQVLIDRNEYVNIEQIRLGTLSIESADGTVVSNISHEDAKHFWHNVASEPVLAVKEKIEELTYGEAQFNKLIENQDFLS